MEDIPVLYLQSDYKKNPMFLTHLREIMKKEGFKNLYIIDEQAIKKNKPQYEFYQRTSSLFDLWVDTGPRKIDDVVDDVFSGTKKIIIRPDFWHETDFTSIRELTEQEIVLAIDIKKSDSVIERNNLMQDANGIILFFNGKNQLDFKTKSLINEITIKKDLYIFDLLENKKLWNSKNIKGFLIDIDKFM